MKKYIVRKIGIGILQIFVVSVAIFCILHVLPGDPVDALVSEKVPQEKKEELREEWGFNKPLTEQYADWAKGVLSGDLGKSLKTGLKISDSMAMRVSYSLRLCGIALFFQVLVSILLGSIAAWKRDGIFDRIVMEYSLITSAIPTFWIGMVLILLFGVELNILPASGYTSWKHYIMPILAIVLGGLSMNTRLIRSEVIGAMNERYVLTAYAKGLPENKILFLHVLRNAMIVIIVNTFLSLPWIIAGSVVVENIFAIPGMGAWMTNAVINRDIPVVQACVLIISILTVFANLLSDILVAFMDPRVRIVE